MLVELINFLNLRHLCDYVYPVTGHGIFYNCKIYSKAIQISINFESPEFVCDVTVDINYDSAFCRQRCTFRIRTCTTNKFS